MDIHAKVLDISDHRQARPLHRHPDHPGCRGDARARTSGQPAEDEEI